MHMAISFNPDGTAKLEIDGQDITQYVLAKDFRIDLADRQDRSQAHVHMTLKPRSLDITGDIVEAPDALFLLLGGTEAVQA